MLSNFMEFHIIFKREDLLPKHRELPLKQITTLHLPAALVELYPTQRLVFCDDGGWRKLLRPEADELLPDPVVGDTWLARIPLEEEEERHLFPHADVSFVGRIGMVGHDLVSITLPTRMHLRILKSNLIRKLP
jgi:hypothetical protein